MKKKQLTVIVFLTMHLTPFAFAGNNKGEKATTPFASNKIQSGCSNGFAQTDLDINNVRTRLLTDGDMWWNLSNAKYEIPKGSGKHSMFSGALWIGGTDVAGNIKIAAQTYRQTGNDFWPGAVDLITTDVTPARCLHYDKHWKITKADVQNFIAGGSPTADMISYPGNGDATFNEDQFLAPFFDANADGIYNVMDGDYPNYNFGSGSPGGNCNNYLFGDQTLWWVFNDLGNVHTETGGDQIGLEIRAQAFAFATTNDLDNTTFYKYEIINRSNQTVNNCYFGQWADPDLGKPTDDFVGCHVMKGLGYCYNGDADDDGAQGYGLNPPAIGIDFLQGPLADPGDGIDNDKDGITDEPGEQIIMSSFVYYNNVNNTPNGNPSGAQHYYNYLQSIWADGQHMTYGSDGRIITNPICNYMFPDFTDPDFPTTQWTEITAGNAPEDRRFLMSAGKFTLQPGAVNYVTTAVLWARAATGGPMASVNLLFAADSLVQELFDSCFVLTASINELQSIQSSVAPNPFSSFMNLTFKNDAKEIFTLKVFDLKGKLVRTRDNINSNIVTLQKCDLTKGVYIYKLESKSKKFATGKLIVE